MRRNLLALLSIALLSFGLSAQASTITPGVYNLYDAFVAGYSVTGTVPLNNTGYTTAANLTFNDPNLKNPGLPVFNDVLLSFSYNGLGQDYIISNNNAGQIALFFNTTSTPSGSLNLCVNYAQCGTSPGTTGASSLQAYAFYNSATGSNPGLANTNFSGGYLSQASNPALAPASALAPEPESLFFLGASLLCRFGVRCCV